MNPVTAETPCPVGGGITSDGGLIVCGRSETPVDRVADSSKKEVVKPTDWTAEATRFAERLTPAARTALSQSLRLPESAFAALPLIGVSGTAGEGYAYTLPEVDGNRRVIGLSTRNPDSTKKMRPGGKRGLTVMLTFVDIGGPVLLVEGASDTLALTAAGLCAVGRPSNTGGVRHLATLLKDDRRPIVVVGENDAKPDGAWPGRDGAIRTAESLAKALGRDVAWTLPPDDAKDVRAWLMARVRPDDPPEAWADAGRALLEHLLAAGRSEVPPEPLPKIVLSVHEHPINDAAIRSLEREPDLYQRAGALTRVIVEPHHPRRVVKRPLAVRIETLPAPTIRERLTRTAAWFRIIVRKDSEEEVPAHPPDWCVAAVQARGDWPYIRRLEAVVEFPVLLPSGEVLGTPGYDADNGLLYQPQYPVKLTVPNRPTRADAVAAVQVLDEVLHDFPLQSPAHRAAWFAALLTPLARFAYSGNTPLFLVDANVPDGGQELVPRLGEEHPLGNAGRPARLGEDGVPADRDRRDAAQEEVRAEGECVQFVVEDLLELLLHGRFKGGGVEAGVRLGVEQFAGTGEADLHDQGQGGRGRRGDIGHGKLLGGKGRQAGQFVTAASASVSSSVRQP